ncbi:MAG: hypothetical protein WC926_00120 [Candidatus Paceibacterota bacterium]|jgi:hypothetical protein
MFNTNGKKIFCLVAALSFIFLFFFTPTCSAFDVGQAVQGAWDWGVGVVSGGLKAIGNSAKAIGDAVVGAAITAIGALFIALSLGFLTFCHSVLMWVISPDFLTVPIISNEFVRGVGLAITIPLANMVIFLSLIAIGLGTALRLDKFDAKKNLLQLLMVALLINFAPVFCGVVIDVSNILMNFFLGGGSDGLGFLVNNFNNAAKTQKVAWEVGAGNGVAVSLLANTIAIVAFNWTAGGAFLLFAWLFLQRYVVLWVLVILSPIMASFMILPATRGWWEKWLDQFLSWCFIGTIASFYLYLANHMIDLIGHGKLLGGAGQDLGVVGSSLLYLVPLILLHYGFFKTMESSAIGSGAVVKFAQTNTKKARNWGFTAPTKLAAKTEVGRKVTNAIADADKWGQGKKGFGGWAKRSVGGVIGSAGIKMADKRDELMSEKAKKAAKMSDRQISHELMHGLMTPAEKALLVSTLIKDKDKDVQKKGRKEVEGKTLEQLAKWVDALKKEGQKDAALPIFLAASGKKIADGSRAIVPEDIGFDNKSQLSEEERAEWDKKKWNSQSDKVWSNKENIENAAEGFWESSAASSAIRNFWGSEEMGAATKKFKEPLVNSINEGTKNLLENIENIETTDPVRAEELFKEYVRRNPKLASYGESSAGQAAGIVSMWERAPKAIKDQYDEKAKNGKGYEGKGYKKFLSDLAKTPAPKSPNTP